jgi:hypothetical protein
MTYKVNHTEKKIVLTSEEQTFEENLEIAQFVGKAGYSLVEYVKPKKKRQSKNKEYYLKRFTNEADKEEFIRILSVGVKKGSHAWQDAKAFAKSKGIE